jgi:mRNA interferase YafQ
VYKVSYGNQFEKELKHQILRGKNPRKLWDIVNRLVKGEQLDPKHRNHKLKGDFKDCWECHIEPDWLLIYHKLKDELIFVSTGTHSDLFG